jgi:phage gp37-like protein
MEDFFGDMVRTSNLFPTRMMMTMMMTMVGHTPSMVVAWLGRGNDHPLDGEMMTITLRMLSCEQ